MTYLSPNNSPAHLAFRNFAAAAGKEEAARIYVKDLNATPNLDALLLNCYNVKLIWTTAEQEWGLSAEEWGLEVVRDVPSWIVANKEQLAQEIGGRFSAGFDADGRHPLRGYLERNSVFSALCNSHEDPELRDRYRLVQAHVLVIHALAMRKYTTLEEYESHCGSQELLRKRANPYPAALALRNLSYSSHEALLRALPLHLPPEELLDELDSVIPDLASDSQLFRHLVIFSQKAIGDRKQGTRSWTSGGIDGSGATVQGGRTDFEGVIIVDEEEGDGPDDTAHHSTVKRVKLTRKEMNALLDGDECPLEDSEEEEENGHTGFDDPAFNRDPGAFQEASIAQQNHRVMANQMFPFSFGTLVPAELNYLIIDRTRRILRLSASKTLNDEELDELEVITYANVVFVLSSSPKEALSLKFFGFNTVARDTQLALIQGKENDLPRFRIRAPLPNYRRPQESVPAGMDRKRTEYLELPDIANCSALIFELLRQKGRWEEGQQDTSGKENGPSRELSANVFRRRHSWYERNLKNLLHGIDPTGRLTPGRLANFMFSRLLAKSRRDLTAAAIITGRRNVSLAKVRLFYSCRNVRKLQMLYVTVVSQVCRELCRISGCALPETLPYQLDSGHKYVGSRICPPLEKVRDAVTALINAISESSQYSDNEGYRRHFNLYTLYTVLMVFYYTSLRPSKKNLRDFDVDDILGIAMLCDKDGGTGYKARLAAIFPKLLQQIEFYRDFISRNARIHQADRMSFFFLDEQMNPLEVRPNTMLPILREFMPWAINVHRRLVSSELLDRKCSRSIEDCWSGHAHRGEEWWHDSSLSFPEYRRELEKFLLPLLEDEIGFRPVKGFSLLRRKNDECESGLGKS